MQVIQQIIDSHAVPAGISALDKSMARIKTQTKAKTFTTYKPNKYRICFYIAVDSFLKAYILFILIIGSKIRLV